MIFHRETTWYSNGRKHLLIAAICYFFIRKVVFPRVNRD